MESIVINGGNKLRGEIDIQGSKNSVLPILAACVVVDGVSVIHNCPKLTDVDAAIKILEHIGCEVKRENHTLTVDSRNVSCYNIPTSLMREMRSSIVFLGSVISRLGRAELSLPGGCEIGLRPIDLHLSSFRALGVKIDESFGNLSCEAELPLKAATISLSFPSVGATENIILASVFARGRTVILNAAREPEITDLAAFLNKCGCRVSVEPEGTVVIDGVKKAFSAEHTVISDRIVALTYMSAVGAAGGDVLLKKVDPSHFMSVNSVFEKAGCEIRTDSNSVRIISDGRLKCVRDIRTMPYPGFPTDAQAPVMTMLCKARGTSVVVENIFESRYKHVSELVRMGANIKVEGRVAIIDGVDTLYGANVESIDLRGGSALVVAGLAAKGKTVISGVKHIDRGYEKIEDCLRNVGADIERGE
ncbi:MAG: UDP-N-acetylglucosamine 1-carboxyvinyltransferase [Faecalibacterium sp.]|nr:UDP-N-acetylglucosamine 1-carboxyvinyltransferase [Ruminococcus sp.]MCM1392858.1 UDP-N-acetylglucosamine 1-carboxyvinyltransferase [Ruminococcus sp.]MCM1485415.1 UDP-N-acetylglucosamine 1-carboxyvinyltransferase [Faecalibacterium sp.]